MHDLRSKRCNQPAGLHQESNFIWKSHNKIKPCTDMLHIKKLHCLRYVFKYSIECVVLCKISFFLLWNMRKWKVRDLFVKISELRMHSVNFSSIMDETRKNTPFTMDSKKTHVLYISVDAKETKRESEWRAECLLSAWNYSNEGKVVSKWCCRFLQRLNRW